MTSKTDPVRAAGLESPPPPDSLTSLAWGRKYLVYRSRTHMLLQASSAESAVDIMAQMAEASSSADTTAWPVPCWATSSSMAPKAEEPLGSTGRAAMATQPVIMDEN
mgnify:CR=1 FL=1